MTATLPLEPADREFFAALAEVIFSNPFDEAHPGIVALAARAGDAPPPPTGHPFGALVPAVDARLARLARQGVDRLERVASEDRRLFEYAFLFRAYHRHTDDLDALIAAELRGGEPPEANFAEALLADLARCGFAATPAQRHLALFYQLRRAYYFIDRALVGASPCMRRLRHALWNNVFTADVRVYGDHLWDRMEDFSTLLLGETGTGKGTAAAAIGRSGLIPFERRRRRFAASFTRTFIATNLSQYPESLIESELFGHRKGAFTGAIDDHRGLFERCSAHGSLFLDEVGELGVPVQIKLLNVLQERRFTPVGSHELRRFEGRVIAATNRPLDVLRREGRFRDDLYYRLCSDVIEVPPLRQRLAEAPGELAELVTLLVERLTGEAQAQLAAMVVERLSDSLPGDYPWPGNVRELEQAVRRVLLSGRYVPGATPAREDEAESLAAALRAGRLGAGELLARYCHLLHERLGSYEAVARRVALDRRTVRRHVEAARHAARGQAPTSLSNSLTSSAG